MYPESDGKPLADNTRQFEYIVMIEGGLAVLFADRPDVFVAGDLLWYPVEGKPHIRAAPDAMVAFGRPPGHRGSYIQHDLATRHWVCPECNTTHDRDVNAARNIKAAGLAVFACGETVNPVVAKAAIGSTR